MAQQARTFRVFVSSTFSNLKAERNASQERVFPRLRELATGLGATSARQNGGFIIRVKHTGKPARNLIDGTLCFNKLLQNLQ